MTEPQPAAAPPDVPPLVDLPDGALGRLAPLLQQGVRVRVRDGVTVGAFLVEDLGVDPEYVRGRITTVFLDGSVVDDLDAARLREGSSLALSAAMPGLVGATLRKGGYYAAMREAITLAAERAPAGGRGPTVEVRIKLFNLLIEELGPALLAHGVALEPGAAAALLGGPVPGARAGAAEVWLRLAAR